MDAVMELEIGPGPEPDSYVVEVLRSVGGGEPTATFTLDLEELLDRRPRLEDNVLSSSVSARRIMSATEAAIQGVGRQLFDSVFRDDVGTAYRTSLAVASNRGRGVQIVLRLTAPGLAALPWEALYDSEAETYLCRKEPLVRHVPAPYSPPALALQPPLRVLGMISSPRGLPPLDVDGEKELLEEALRPHLDAGRVRIDWLDQVTWPLVHDKLLEREWHVLHFIGHGTYDTATDEGVLAFVGRDGRADYVSASSLADLLDEAEPSPRLVLLNSCRSGAGGTEDLFSGTAAALVHSGIHAVAAMQFSISDTAAIAFARGFYAALAHGRGIDEAVRSGRIGILGITRGTLEWVTPVLYLRGEDTRLFEVAPMPEPDAAPPPRRPETEEPSATKPAVESKPDAASKPVSGAAAAAAAVAATAATTSGERLVAGIGSDVARVAAPSATPMPPASMPTTSSPPPPPPPPPRPVAPVSQPSAPPGPTPVRTTRAPGGPPPVPPGRPVSTHPPSAPGPPRRSRPRWKPWLVVGLIVAAVVVGATTVLVLRPWAGVTDVVAEEDVVPPEEAPAPDPPPVESPPLATEVIPGNSWEWIAIPLSCGAGETFRMVATGTILLNGSEESRVGPGGWPGESPGYQGQFGFAPGALIGRLDTLPEEEGFAFGHDGVATYTCPVPGNLWLGISDPGVDDNSGEFSVQIWKSAAG